MIRFLTGLGVVALSICAAVAILRVWQEISPCEKVIWKIVRTVTVILFLYWGIFS